MKTGNSNLITSRFSLGAHVEVARRRGHIATVLLRHPFGIAQADARPAMSISVTWYAIQRNHKA